jgi:DNA modification methylase
MIKSEDIELGGVCVKVFNDDCLNVLREMPDNSVDSIVTDPPYGISFMAKKWDYDVPSVKVWKEALRVLKPGGHALIACGTRTQHRMVCNIEDAGFEIRDVVSWIYGSGFPKSLNISKAIDKAAGAEREVVGERSRFGDGANRRLENAGAKGRTGVKFGYAHTKKEDSGGSGAVGVVPITAPATDEAKQWDGWGTSLKPSVEFFTLCRKPLSEKTVAANVLKWGTGGINIDGCRVEGISDSDKNNFHQNRKTIKEYKGDDTLYKLGTKKVCSAENPQGRFPANLIHDGSQEVLDLFPETKSAVRKPSESGKAQDGWGLGARKPQERGHDDQGSAARFFYCPKASKKDRNEGNNHPTVKPTALMAYLCRLITPTGGVVLDPYMGSGSTGKAAVREGFSFVGIELDPDYYEICKARIIK